MDSVTKNNHYAFLNLRFDERAGALHKLGFRYESVQEYGIAVFIRGNVGRKPTVIQASTVLYADDIVWNDRIADVSADAFPIPA